MILKFISKLTPLAITAALSVSTMTFAQAQADKTTGDVTKKPTEVTTRVPIDESLAKVEKTAPAADLVAVEVEKTQPEPIAAKTLTATVKESSVKTIPSGDNTTLAELPKQTTPDDSKWQFGFAPYLYMTGLEGTIGARNRTAAIDLSFGDIMSSFKVGLMGAFEARKKRFVLLNDLVWLKLAEENDTPGGLYSSTKVGVNMFIWDLEGGYRVVDSDKGSFDVIGGFRMMSLETNVNFRTGILPGFDVSERKTWATPVIGGRGVVDVAPKVFLSTKFDVGGGVGADFTGQFYAGAGYRITPKIALIGGWRYMKTDYDSNEGFLFDTSMNGIMIGAKFSF